MNRRSNPAFDEGAVQLGLPIQISTDALRFPVSLRQSSDLAAVAFSVEFDASGLTSPRLVLIDTIANTSVITLNLVYQAEGGVGILIDSEASLTNRAEIGFLLFDRIAEGDALVRISDFPVRRSAIDSDGNSIVLTEQNLHSSLQGLRIANFFGF